MLPDAGADVKLVSNDDTTALMLASAEGHSEIAALLLEAGADEDLWLNDGSTAMLLMLLT